MTVIKRTSLKAQILQRMPTWVCAVLPARKGNDCGTFAVVVWFPYLTV